MIDLGLVSGYDLMFWLIRLLSYFIIILAIWGLIDPQKFFGGRVYALVGLMLAGELYVASMVMANL